jgi:hypothetical protein
VERFARFASEPEPRSREGLSSRMLEALTPAGVEWDDEAEMPVIPQMRAGARARKRAA